MLVLIMAVGCSSSSSSRISRSGSGRDGISSGGGRVDINISRNKCRNDDNNSGSSSNGSW